MLHVSVVILAIHSIFQIKEQCNTRIVTTRFHCVGSHKLTAFITTQNCKNSRTLADGCEIIVGLSKMFDGKVTDPVDLGVGSNGCLN